MTDDRKARPLSGEIMTGVARESEARAPGRDAGPDIVDADFVTLRPDTPVWPDALPAEPRARSAQSAASPGMDILKGEAVRAARRGGPAFWLFGTFLVAGAFWISGGHALFARPQAGLPQAAHWENARQALRITGVTSRIERRGERTFLLVDGEVANDGGAGAVLPGIEISVAGKDGRTTRYFLGTNDRRIEPGGRFAFSSRLETPKDGVETVTVDFRRGAS